MLGPGIDLSKVVIVDNTPENFAPQKENGLHIKSWHYVPGDIECK
jgi:TFIIF-interacting CTD phosphatase-like protein